MQVARKNIIFTRVSLKLLLTILSRFENNTQVFQAIQGEVKKMTAIIQDQDLVKIELYQSLKRNPKRSQKRQSTDAPPFTIGNSTNKQAAAGGKEVPQDDSQIQQALDPQAHQEEAATYMNLKTTEKLIINLMQCLIQTGSKVLVEFIRDEVLQAYLALEKKYKFQNKGLHYLLGLFEKDVAKLLQFSRHKDKQERLAKVRSKKNISLPQLVDIEQPQPALRI
mmetsp:Transcript_29766/g.45366  ORF Transcript_29766/g.45366 Transcript_29766/m.45366 type:complete len:223 (+) Transcript_29766:2155-2823(+)